MGHPFDEGFASGRRARQDLSICDLRVVSEAPETTGALLTEGIVEQ